jgi:hypothetical protein
MTGMVYKLAYEILYSVEEQEGVIRCNYGMGVFYRSAGRYHAYN